MSGSDDAKAPASVFISYSRRDQPFVHMLVEAFARAGRPAWLDTADIPPVSLWSTEIAEAIDAADAVVCVLSPDFARSEQCAHEIAHAEQQQKRLIPVVARPVDPGQVLPAIASRQWIPFAPDGFDAAFAVLLTALDTDLDWVKAHTRFQARAREWEASGRDTSRVLRGGVLREAESWLENARDRQPPPTLLQTQHVAASRRAATRVQRTLVSALAGGLAITVVLASVALLQRNAAREARDQAVSRLYTQQLARVGDLAATDPGLALETLDDTLRSAGALREFTWDLYYRLGSRLVFATGGMQNASTVKAVEPVIALSGDGSRLAATQVRRAKRPKYSPREVAEEIVIWNTVSGTPVATLLMAETPGGREGRITSIAFSPDDRLVAASAGLYPTVIKVWNVGSGDEVMSITEEADLSVVAFSRGAAPPETGSGQVRLIAAGMGGVLVWDDIGPHPSKRRLSSDYVRAMVADSNSSSVTVLTPSMVNRWDVSTGTREGTASPATVLEMVAISPDGKRIAQPDSGSVSVWRTGTARPEWQFAAGHREGVNVVAFSTDARRLASGGSDHMVRVWDLDRGAATVTFRGPSAAVVGLTFSADGRRLAAAADDGTVFVWDIDGSPVRPAGRVEAPGVAVCAAASVERPAMVAGSADAMRLSQPGNARATPVVVPAATRSCGIAADGRTIFFVDGQSRVTIADAQTGAVRMRLGATSEPASVRLTSDGGLVAAQAGPRTFTAWQSARGRSIATIDAGGDLHGPFALLDQGVVVAQFQNQDGWWIGAWDVHTTRRLSLTAVQEWRFDGRFAVCAAPLLVATSNQYTLQVVDLASGGVRHQVTWNQGGNANAFNAATGIAFSRDCARLAVGDQAGDIALWDLHSDALVYRVAAHSGFQETAAATQVNAAGVVAIDFSPDGRTLASGGGTAAGRGELKLWDASRGTLLATLPADGGTVTRLAFSATGARLGVLLERPRSSPQGAATTLEVWSAEGPERVVLDAGAGAIERLTYLADGGYLVSEGASLATSWNLARMQVNGTSPRTRIAATPRYRSPTVDWPDHTFTVFAEGSSLFVARPMEEVHPLVSDDADREFHSAEIQRLVLVPRLGLVSLAGVNSLDKPAELVLWDMKAGRPAREAFEPSNVVEVLEFSADGRRFVTAGAVGNASQDVGFVHVWDAGRFTSIQALIGHHAKVTAATFSPDGRQLATGDAAGFVRLWDLPAAGAGAPQAP